MLEGIRLLVKAIQVGQTLGQMGFHHFGIKWLNKMWSLGGKIIFWIVVEASFSIATFGIFEVS